MPKRNKIKIRKRADIAIKSLNPKEQERVLNLIEYLENFPKDRYIDKFVHQIEGWDSTYATKVNEYLRIIFSYKNERVVIEDVINKESFLEDQ